MGQQLAQALDGELDVVLVRKLRAPFNPEFAIGSIDESAGPISRTTPSRPAAPRVSGTGEAGPAGKPSRGAARSNAVAAADRSGGAHRDRGRRRAGYRATMISALHALRARKPARLICAVPVAPPDTLEKIRGYADEVVCLQAPPFFQAVGQFYADFPRLTTRM